MFQKLKYKLYGFMQGRYGGNDGLNLLLAIIYFVLVIMRAFIRNKIAGYIIYFLSLAVIIYAFFRILSKNIYARQKENAIIMNFWYKIKPRFILFKDRIRDIRTHRYRTCPNCKKILRLPYKRGKHTVKCPKCGHQFGVRIL